MEKTIHKSKKWLDPHTTGFIYSTVYTEDSYKSAVLKLADCSKIVQFDTYINTPKERKATLKKVGIMLEDLTKFKEAIESYDIST